MSAPEPARIPKWSAPILWILGTLLLSPRYGWSQGNPGAWNLLGLIPIAAGLGMIAWGASLHFASTANGWRMETTPRYLITRGPYKFSRNPMYVLELAMWFGWAIFYGSISVFIMFLLWWVAFYFLVPYEERQLKARFGDAFLNYQRNVPRWFKLPPW